MTSRLGASSRSLRRNDDAQSAPDCDKLDCKLDYGGSMRSTASGFTEIGAFDAKTKLSEILRKVKQGERFTITVRGRAVADVVPSENRTREREAKAVRQLLAMPKIIGVPAETVEEWIKEGRE